MNVQHISIAFFVYIAGLSGVAGFCLWTSRINQFFFFGRTLPRELAMSPVAKQITRRYMQRILFKFCATVVVFAGLRLIVGIPLLPSFVLACILQIVGFHVAFARAHREAGVAFDQQGAMSNAEAGSEAEMASRVIAVPLLTSKVPARSRLSTIVLPLVAVGVVWLIVMAVNHVSFASLANAVDANGGSELIGFGVGMLFAGTLFSLLVRYSARYRTPMAQCTLRTMFLLEWAGVLAIGASALAVPMHFAITHTMTRAVIFPALALAVVYAAYSRGRLKQFAPPQVELHGDQFWRWGLFYNNAADPALFIQARTGPGYTLNFGKLLAWPIVAAVFGYIVLVVVMGFHHF
jgi:hypothetical protein